MAKATLYIQVSQDDAVDIELVCTVEDEHIAGMFYKVLEEMARSAGDYAHCKIEVGMVDVRNVTVKRFIWNGG